MMNQPTENTAQTAQTPQEATGAPQDPMEEARHLLAGIEAEIQGGEADLATTLHQGHEHFRKGMEKATKGLQEENLDAWTHQSASMARVQSATEGVNMPAEKAPKK